MARDWEAWLQTAAQPASAIEEAERDRTLTRIQRAIANSTEIDSSKVRVYVKGSYASNTNVRRDSDVDVAVEWTGWSYIRRHTSIKDKTDAELGINLTTQGPSPAEFRAQIERALISTFGAAPVDTSGDKAITVSRGTDSLDADVVPCFRLNFYHGRGDVHRGHRLWPRSGGWRTTSPSRTSTTVVRRTTRRAGTTSRSCAV